MIIAYIGHDSSLSTFPCKNSAENHDTKRGKDICPQTASFWQEVYECMHLDVPVFFQHPARRNKGDKYEQVFAYLHRKQGRAVEDVSDNDFMKNHKQQSQKSNFRKNLGKPCKTVYS